MVAHAFSPSTWETEVDLYEYQASLVYKVSSRTGSKAAQRNPVSKNKQKEKKNKREGGIV